VTPTKCVSCPNKDAVPLDGERMGQKEDRSGIIEVFRYSVPLVAAAKS
jgi:hypothetical protein